MESYMTKVDNVRLGLYGKLFSGLPQGGALDGIISKLRQCMANLKIRAASEAKISKCLMSILTFSHVS
jgi:hypothetical protein